MLPRGVKLIRKKVKSTAGASLRAVGARRLDVSSLGRNGAARVVVKLKRGAVRLTGRTRSDGSQGQDQDVEAEGDFRRHDWRAIHDAHDRKGQAQVMSKPSSSGT